MPKRSFQDGRQFAWDSTSLTLAQTCPRKYYYKMHLDLRPKATSVHLIFGGIYASALEMFYKLRATDHSVDEALRKVVLFALRESWDHEAGHAKVFNDAKKTRVNLIRTIVWYVDQFAIESPDGLVTYHLQSGKPAVELSFTVEANDEILLCGHLDRVVSMSDHLYIMDQKTTGGTVGTYYFSHFDLDNQMSLYPWAGQTVLHSPIRGVIIDAAQVAVNFTRFERGITTRSKDQLAEWFEGAMETIYRIRGYDPARPESWPMNLTACRNYGGCEFRHICAVSPSVRENYIKSDFTTESWDPLKAR